MFFLFVPFIVLSNVILLFPVEIAHQASITEPKIIVTIPECYDTVLKGLKSAKIQAKIVLVADPSKTLPSDVTRYSDVAESGEVDFALLDKVEKKGDDVACIPFSSGTTGLPKGVEISYDNLMAAMSVMHQPENCFPELAHGKFHLIYHR